MNLYSTSTRKIYYLENSEGEIVRALQWDTDKLYLVYRKDTHRVEAYNNLDSLKEKKKPYELLHTVQKDVFKNKKSFELNSSKAHLRIVEESETVRADVTLPEDKDEVFYKTLKNVAAMGGAFVFILFVLSFFINPNGLKEEQLQVVQVLDRTQIEKPKTRPPTVTPLKTPRHKEKIKQVQVAKKVKPKKPIKEQVQISKARTSKTAQVRPMAPLYKQNQTQKNKTPSLSQMGALSAFGSSSSSKQKGGIQLDNVPTSPGVGLGGTQGSGGIQTAVYSKGLFSAPLGSGQKANGGGGHGTQGKGGGQGGYGKISLAGSSQSFFEPISGEAWVEGGLDENEIAAVIQRHLSEVRFCYERGLQDKPNLSGRVSMKFMIGPSGSVTTAQINQSSLRHPEVESCIRNRLKGWKFPQPQGGVTVKVTYPFILRRVTNT